jgi:hypothetical protein
VKATLRAEEETNVKTHGLPRRVLAIALSLTLAGLSVPRAQAAPHLVAPEQVAKQLLDAAQTREARQQLYADALGTPAAQKQARLMGLDPKRLQAAVPHLTDAELKDLSARAARAKDVRAGHGGDGLAILGIMLLVAGVAVLLAVANDDYYYDECYCY